MKQVGIIMGSKSDLPVMQKAIDILKGFGIESDVKIVSAHRTPEIMFEYAKNARTNGIKVIIAGAGGAAHLPGMVASISTLPIIGVPVKSRNSIDGWDSILSILQMPEGVPVATVALNGASNAGIIAAQILALNDSEIFEKLSQYKESIKEKIEQEINPTYNLKQIKDNMYLDEVTNNLYESRILSNEGNYDLSFRQTGIKILGYMPYKEDIEIQNKIVIF